ncbi:VapE domain-containing protein [Bacillota bacterium Meth-B3]
MYDDQFDPSFEMDDEPMCPAPVETVMETDKWGNPKKTVENFLVAMRHDAYFAGVRYNELKCAPETSNDGPARPWTGEDDARAINYIENSYGLFDHVKFKLARRVLFSERRYHPVRQIVGKLEWDGEDRIERFLTEWMKCDDTPYVRECSRLIFAGGVNRLYRPGCKFDDMVVLVGTNQGEGKTTLVHWLAIEDRFYTDVKEFDGQRGIEEILGSWICEVGELLAFTRARETEAIKAFLSRQVDRCRHPYDEHTMDHPRQCIFIGTTNKRQFLVDKTGGRRFYPVDVHQSAYELYAREAECKAYILQCWAEAKAKLDTPFMSPKADIRLIEEIRDRQAEAVEDDWRIGVIEEYLSRKAIGERVFVQELRVKALYPNIENLRDDKKESTEIGIIMQGMPGWHKEAKPSRQHGMDRCYGPQRCWIKKDVNKVETTENEEEDDDELPF